MDTAHQGQALQGRAEPLAVLSESAAALATGTGSTLLLVGEAGIGKTSLLEVLSADLERRGIRCRRAVADETDVRRPLGLCRQLVRDIDGDGPGDGVDRFVAEIEELSVSGPVALLVDDLQWADELTLGALRSMARRARELGVLVAVTSRPAVGRPPVLRFAELVESIGRCVHLAPLDADQLADVAEARLGAPPGPQLLELLAATAGNPFMSVELLAGLEGEGRIDRSAGLAELTSDEVLPQSLSRRLAQRTTGLVPGSDVLLRALSVVGGGAGPEELAAIIDLAEADVLNLVLANVDAGVLVDQRAALRFRHDLIRQALVSESPAAVLAALARRATEVLHDRSADPERVASTFLAWADPGDPNDVERLLALGDGYRKRHPGAAADLLSRGLVGLDAQDGRGQEVAERLAWALVDAGRPAEIGSLLTEYFGPPSPRDPASVRQLRGMVAGMLGRFEEADATPGPLMAEALADWADPDNVDEVDSMAELAFMCVMAARPADAITILEWVDAAPADSTPFRRAAVATTEAWLAAIDGRFEDGIAKGQIAVELTSTDTTRRMNPATPSIVLCVCLDQAGRADEAQELARRVIAGAGPYRWVPPVLHYFLALSQFRLGAWDEALAEVDSGHRAGDETDLALGIYWPYGVSAIVALARGELTEARGQLREAAEAISGSGLGREWLVFADAMITAAEGGTEHALDLVELAVGAVEAAEVPALLLNWGPDMMLTCLDQGRDELARRIGANVEEACGRCSSPVVAALARWSQGLLIGDGAVVAGAGAELAGMGRIPEAARAAHHAAVLYAAAGDLAQARTVAKEAFFHYEAMGADHWRRQLRSRLRDVGLDMRPRRYGRRATTGWASLTSSEETIVNLVGQGLTNAEIAERLFVSRRTVESHLGRVYTKLSLTNRAQLVAAANSERS